jgi:hypothetical protein
MQQILAFKQTNSKDIGGQKIKKKYFLRILFWRSKYSDIVVVWKLCAAAA